MTVLLLFGYVVGLAIGVALMPAVFWWFDRCAWKRAQKFNQLAKDVQGGPGNAESLRKARDAA